MSLLENNAELNHGKFTMQQLKQKDSLKRKEYEYDAGLVVKKTLASDVKGKLALVQRGSITFAEKQQCTETRRDWNIGL